MTQLNRKAVTAIDINKDLNKFKKLTVDVSLTNMAARNEMNDCRFESCFLN